MASMMLTRVLVYLKQPSGTYTQANFKQCIFEELGFKGENMESCRVECKLENNKLILNPSIIRNENTTTTGIDYLLKHPQFCPAMNMSESDIESLSKEVLGRGINVGVAVILESADDCVLLTRRASHMRTFPGVWVPPGGHIELDETIEAAGLRELSEETGLIVSPSDRVSSRILGLWESIFPPLLTYGLPQRHHIVVYMHIVLNKTSDELNNKLKFSPDEVDAGIWLPSRLVERVSTGSEVQIDEKLKYIQVDINGEHTANEMDSSVLNEKMPPPGVDPERISTGTRFALDMWLKEKQNRDTSIMRSSL